MKKEKLLYRSACVLFGVAIALFIFSCKKEHNTSGAGEDSKFVFTVSGVEDPNRINVKFASAEEGANVEKYKPVFETLPFGGKDDLMFETSSEITKMESFLGETANPSVKTKVNSKLAGTSPLEVDKVYKIFLFESGNGPFVTSAIAKSGTPTEIWVDETKTYDWYAVSFNEADESALASITEASFNVQTPVDKDLLYAKGAGITTRGKNRNVNIDIRFAHKVAVVSLSVDAYLVPGDLTSVIAEFKESNYFNSGVLDLKTGTVGAVTSQSAQDPVFTADPNHHNAMMTNYYTADPSNLTTLTVNFKEINITKHEDSQNVNMVTEQDGNVPFIPVNFSFTSPAVGDRLSGGLYLFSTLPKMHIMHVSEFAVPGGGREVTPTKDYVRIGIPWDLLPECKLYNNSPTYESYDVKTWIGLTGFLRHNFTVVLPPGKPVPHNYIKYFPGSGTFPVREPFTSVVVKPGELGDKLLANNPDVVFMAIDKGKLDPAGNAALITYVENGGVVIMMIASDKYETYSAELPTWNYNNLDSYGSALPFLKKFFGPNVAMHPTRFERLKKPTFRINKEVNDVVTNSFFGDYRGKHWAVYNKDYVSHYMGGGVTGQSVEGEAIYVSGMDPSSVVEYSGGPALNAAYRVPSGFSTPPNNASIMFRHKDRNIFYIGNSDFASVYEYIHLGYVFRSAKYPFSTSHGLDVNGNPFTRVKTNTGEGATEVLHNSGIMGNVLFWAFRQAAYGR